MIRGWGVEECIGGFFCAGRGVRNDCTLREGERVGWVVRGGERKGRWEVGGGINNRTRWAACAAAGGFAQRRKRLEYLRGGFCTMVFLLFFVVYSLKRFLPVKFSTKELFILGFFKKRYCNILTVRYAHVLTSPLPKHGCPSSCPFRSRKCPRRYPVLALPSLPGHQSIPTGFNINQFGLTLNRIGGLPKKTETYVFFQIENAQAFRTQLTKLVPMITSTAQVQADRATIAQNKKDAKEKNVAPPLLKMCGVNISFTHTGLVKVGGDVSFAQWRRAEGSN